MTYIPGFNGPIPSTPVYPTANAAPVSSPILPYDEEPLIYTTTGPLPVAGGLAFTKDALVLDAQLIVGILNGGIYGSQA
jgi:hypothetical protein